MKDIPAWVYSRERQAQILPAEHPGLGQALVRLWESEVGSNLVAIALQAGVVPSLKTAMGATLSWAISNDDEAFEAYRTTTTTTPSGLTVAKSTEGLDTVASTLEALRGPQR